MHNISRNRTIKSSSSTGMLFPLNSRERAQCFLISVVQYLSEIKHKTSPQINPCNPCTQSSSTQHLSIIGWQLVWAERGGWKEGEMDYLTDREQGTAGGFSSPSATLFCLDEAERRQEVACSLLRSKQSSVVQGTQQAGHRWRPRPL